MYGTFQFTLGASTKSHLILFFTGTTTTDLQSYLTRGHLSHLETLFDPVHMLSSWFRAS